MKELSIFVDESGDFGHYEHHSPYYIISMIIHDQDIDFSPELDKLNTRLMKMGNPSHCFHSGPIIRQEDEYRFLSISERQKISKNLLTFLRNIDIKFTTFYICKKQIIDKSLLSKSFLTRYLLSLKITILFFFPTTR